MSLQIDNTSANCLFCKVISGQISATIVERGEYHLAFRDIAPQAPEHLLVVPTAHVPAVSLCLDPHMLGIIFAAAARLGARIGSSDGFRLVVNEGVNGGQTIEHLHIHIFAGRQMQWPPG